MREEALSLRYEGEIVACDFYVQGIEQGEEVVGGYRKGRILNIDHHAPTARMQRRISSTNLALERLQADLPPMDADALIVINHLDCDSILSAGILSGRLDPDPRFGEAAIAADHTGAEDEIADLLQGIDAELSRRGIHDYSPSFSRLAQLLDDLELDAFAREALDARRCRRAVAEALVEKGRFQKVGPLRFAVTGEPIDGEFFPALLPGAVVIMVASPLPENPCRWQIKLRLGLAAPPGLSLSNLGITEFDPNYGGRWNAGSNRSGGGTELSPEAYAERLIEALENYLHRVSES
jgi:hypothetical protein